jgi:hypothetical protein
MILCKFNGLCNFKGINHILFIVVTIINDVLKTNHIMLGEHSPSPLFNQDDSTGLGQKLAKRLASGRPAALTAPSLSGSAALNRFRHYASDARYHERPREEIPHVSKRSPNSKWKSCSYGIGQVIEDIVEEERPQIGMLDCSRASPRRPFTIDDNEPIGAA